MENTGVRRDGKVHEFGKEQVSRIGSIFKSGLHKVAEGKTSMTKRLDLYWPQLGDSGVA